MIALVRERLNRWLDTRFPVPQPPSAVSIITERLHLRELREEDLPSICAYRGDPEVMRHVHSGPDACSEQLAWFLVLAAREQMWKKSRESYTLGIVLKETGELIGECSLGLLFS